MHRALSIASFSMILLLAACGDDGGTTDGGPDTGTDGGGDGGGDAICGDGVIQTPEQCDDGNEDADDGCSLDCRVECGDGVVGAAETCDSTIADGMPGACPASCDDGDSCTTDTLSGSECTAECAFGPISAPADDDGCCPTGADSTTDNDCTSVCGNGAVEAGETCDTMIADGLAGACPTACDDGEDCTTDALVMDGTCFAACEVTPITMEIDDDMCCPTGSTPATDNDCSATCGDGAVTGTERCDTAIASGMGSCPTACDDGDVCTDDSLTNAGTCRARCRTSPTAAGPADGCCPAGATMAMDPDCSAACGDGTVTAPEECDDGNTMAGDGCDAMCNLEAVAFRFNDLDVIDPHMFARVIICVDVTNTAFGMDGVNPLLQNNITMDGDGDGLLDLSVVESFLPLDQTAGTMTMTDVIFPDCTDPMASTSCTLPAGAPHTTAMASNMGGSSVCLDEIAGTASYSGRNTPTAMGGSTCYVANAGTVTFSLGGIPITLEDTFIAGEWFGSPATEIRDGLLRGFLTEARADATIIPAGTTGIGAIDGQPVSSLLRGGTGSCSQAAPATGDSDMRGSTRGWYFYLNFDASRVPYTEL